MAQWMKVLATKTDDLSSILELTWQEESTDFYKLLSDHQAYAMAHVPTQSISQSINQYDEKFSMLHRMPKLFISSYVEQDKLDTYRDNKLNPTNIYNHTLAPQQNENTSVKSQESPANDCSTGQAMTETKFWPHKNL